MSPYPDGRTRGPGSPAYPDHLPRPGLRSGAHHVRLQALHAQHKGASPALGQASGAVPVQGVPATGQGGDRRPEQPGVVACPMAKRIPKVTYTVTLDANGQALDRRTKWRGYWRICAGQVHRHWAGLS